MPPRTAPTTIATRQENEGLRTNVCEAVCAHERACACAVWDFGGRRLFANTRYVVRRVTNWMTIEWRWGQLFCETTSRHEMSKEDANRAVTYSTTPTQDARMPFGILELDDIFIFLSFFPKKRIIHTLYIKHTHTHLAARARTHARTRLARNRG